MTQPAFVETTQGKFQLRRPTLGGWQRILSTFSDADFEILYQAMTAALAAPEVPAQADPGQKAKIGEAASRAYDAAGTALMSLLPRIPLLIAVCMRECLVNSVDGKRAISETQSLELDDADAMAFIQVVRDSGILAELVARLKNLLARRAPAEPTPAP